MNLSYKWKTIILLVCLFGVCVSCGGFRFEKAATNQHPVANYTLLSENCYVEVLTKFPVDKQYQVLGKCMGSSHKGFWIGGDGTNGAYKRLQLCACQNGGNALVVQDKAEYFIPNPETLPFPNQSRVEIIGTVISIQY